MLLESSPSGSAKPQDEPKAKNEQRREKLYMDFLKSLKGIKELEATFQRRFSNLSFLLSEENYSVCDYFYTPDMFK